MKNYIDILCTRPLDESILQKADSAGIKITSIPFIHTEPIVADNLAMQIAQLAEEPITAVFSSAKAVDAVIPLLPKHPNWKVFCTGGATKNLVFLNFGKNAVIDTAKNASELSEKILTHPEAENLYFFCGDHRLNRIPETLKSNGKDIKEVIVYKTVQTPTVITKDYAGILFFSPTAVHSFFSENTIAMDVVLFSIGQTTTDIIRTYSVNPVITSEWPGQESLIDLVIKYPWKK